MPKDSFSIVIACINSAESLNATLQAISQIEYPDGFEAMVIDDGRAAGREAVTIGASDRGLPVRYVEAQKISRADAWNFAAQESTDEYMAFVDDGCIPPADWLTAFKSAFEVWNTGVVGGPDIPSKNASFLERSLHYVLTSLVGDLGMRSGSDYIGKYYPKPWNMAVRRESIRLGNGFSDNYPECPEVPLIFRMGKIGYKAVYAPDAWVRRSRESNLLGFIRRSFLLGRQRAHITVQPVLARVYACALALVLIPGMLTLYPGTRELGMRALIAVGYAYAAALIFSAIHSVAVTRTPLALPTVPLLTIMHHGSHMAGYLTGMLGRLRDVRLSKR